MMIMIGSDKQIKWAESIRANQAEAFSKLRAIAIKSPIALKAVNFVEHIDNASFWIDHRQYSAERMIDLLLTVGLQIKGFAFGNVAIMDTKTGVITETWEQIVPDGKGGHKEMRSVVIA
jgi:hypothetical protein